MGKLYDAYQDYKSLIYLFRNEKNMSPEMARQEALKILENKKEVKK